MQTFLEYVDKKQREAKRHLKIVAKLLESTGLKVKSHLSDEDEPYIFVHAGKKLSFEGVRIYKIGAQMAFRVQKDEKTHPYGKSYPLDLEDMFKDYISDHTDEEKAGKLVVKAVAKELHRFFDQTHKAERDMLSADFDRGDQNDPLGRVILKTSGSDYSTLVNTQA